MGIDHNDVLCQLSEADIGSAGPGLGRLGLCFAVVLEQAGYKVSDSFFVIAFR